MIASDLRRFRPDIWCHLPHGPLVLPLALVTVLLLLGGIAAVTLGVGEDVDDTVAEAPAPAEPEAALGRTRR